MVHHHYHCGELSARRCASARWSGTPYDFEIYYRKNTGKHNDHLSEPACYVWIKCGRGPYNEGREIWTFNQTLRCSNIK